MTTTQHYPDFIEEMIDRYSTEDPTFRERYETSITEMDLVDQLATLRKKRNLTQTEVAKRMRTTQAAVSRIERQADTKLSTIRNYAQAIGARITIQPL